MFLKYVKCSCILDCAQSIPDCTPRIPDSKTSHLRDSFTSGEINRNVRSMHNRGRNSEQKHETKKLVEFPNHILGAVTLDLLPMGNLGVTAWVGFTLGYDRLPMCGYTLVNYPRGR